MVLIGSAVAVNEKDDALTFHSDLHRIPIICNIDSITQSALEFNARLTLGPAVLPEINEFVLVLPVFKFDWITLMIINVFNTDLPRNLPNNNSPAPINLLGPLIVFGGLHVRQVIMNLVELRRIVLALDRYHLFEVLETPNRVQILSLLTLHTARLIDLHPKVIIFLFQLFCLLLLLEVVVCGRRRLVGERSLLIHKIFLLVLGDTRITENVVLVVQVLQVLLIIHAIKLFYQIRLVENASGL